MDPRLIRRSQRHLACPFVKKVIKDIICKLEAGATITEIFETLVHRIYELVTNQIPVSDLIQTHRVSQQYPLDTFYMKLFTDRLRNQGYVIGNTVSFLVISNHSPFLGDKMILPEEFDPMEYVLDYTYYIKSFGNTLDHLCLNMFPVVSNLDMFRETLDHKTIYINEPIRFIGKYYQCYGSLDRLLPEELKEPNCN